MTFGIFILHPSAFILYSNDKLCGAFEDHRLEGAVARHDGNHTVPDLLEGHRQTPLPHHPGGEICGRAARAGDAHVFAGAKLQRTAGLGGLVGLLAAQQGEQHQQGHSPHLIHADGPRVGPEARPHLVLGEPVLLEGVLVSAVFVLPVVGLFVAQSLGLIFINEQIILWMAAILLVLDIGLLAFAKQLFQRETILTRWK